VRERPVRAAGDDRGERRLGPLAPHLRLELERHLALGPPRQAALRHPAEDLVGERRRRADPLELLRLLDGPQPLDEPAGRDELDALPHQPLEPLEALHAQLVVLEPHPPAEPLGRLLEQVLLAALAVEALHLPLGLHHVAEVREEDAQAGADHADAVGAGVAGQVADVPQVGHEQGVELLLGKQRLEPVRAAHEPPPSSALRISSASR
jgi:hypothetical protein